MAKIVFRKMKMNSRRTLQALVGFVFLLIVMPIGFEYFNEEPAWRSRSMEAGLLRVMKYIEKEREVDSIVRDAFVDRIWKSLKMDLVRDLVNKRNSQRLDMTFVQDNVDVLDDVFTRDVGQISSSEHFPFAADSNNVNNDIIRPDNVDQDLFLSKPILNSFEFSYNYDQSTACFSQSTDVLIAVPSAPGNFKRRQLVRQSERAKFAKNPKNRARLLFFVGYPDTALGEISKIIQKGIDNEQSVNSDIVQGAYIDSYKNITGKAALLLDWSSKFCSNASFLIRTDDDVGVNISKMITAMEDKSAKLDHYILGALRKNWTPIRKSSSKYFLSFEDDPYKEHPRFLLGGAMGYPIKTASLLLAAMRRVVLIWLDDVFVTGFCAKRVGVPIFNSSAFDFKHV